MLNVNGCSFVVVDDDEDDAEVANEFAVVKSKFELVKQREREKKIKRRLKISFNNGNNNNNKKEVV